MPIRVKLSLWYSGVFLLIITLFSSFIYLFFTHREINHFDAGLHDKAQEIHQSIQVIDLYPFPMQNLVLPNIDVFGTPEIFLQVIDRDGHIISRSESLGSQALPISNNAWQEMAAKRDYYETRNVHGTSIRMYYLPLLSDGRFIGALEVASPLLTLNHSLSNLRLLLAIGAVLAASLSAFIGWFLAKKSLDPIHRIIETTSAIEQEGRLDRRISYTGPLDEIGMLSKHINSMMEKIESMYRELEESYEAQRRFVADASHELRTPLTSIRGNLDFIRKQYAEKGSFSMEAMEDVAEEIERISRMVHNLLALARADAGYKIPMEEIHLGEWLSACIAKVENMVPTGVDFNHDPFDLLNGVLIRGNRDFIKQILLILLENAFKYTKSGSVALHFTTEPDLVKFIVKDTGVGIPEKDLSHVFNRFYRGENARSFAGTGLGLSIAKWIADKHGGTLQIQSEVGVGTTVTLVLPTSPSTP
jgi:two-component system, OmpR family, sensor kinase